jgi:hypothetical protein
MPVYLKDVKEFPELEGVGSALLIPCRFCPAASMSVRRDEPYFEIFRRFLKTASYEELIKSMKSRMEEMGIKTDVFRSNLLHQFVLCMWTTRRRKHLAKRAANYEALVVLGCEAAVDTVYDSVNTDNSRVYMGMRSEGIMSVKPVISLPANLSLELNRVTPLVHKAGDPVPWVSL